MVNCAEIEKEAIERHAQQTPPELEEFLRAVVALKKHTTILEIGRATRGTSWAFEQIAKKVVTVDIGKRIPEDGDLHVEGDSGSKETLDKVKKLLGRSKLDCLFIDGRHTYEHTKSDHEMYGPLVRAGGIIAIHDIAGGGLGTEVRRCWEEIRATRVTGGEIIAEINPRRGIGYYYVK